MDNLGVKYLLGLGKKDEAVAKGWADFIGEMPTSYAINPLEKVTPYEKDNWWYILRTLFLLFRCDAIVLLKDWDKLRSTRIQFMFAKFLGLVVFDGIEDESGKRLVQEGIKWNY